jgi:hypothetical protein
VIRRLLPPEAARHAGLVGVGALALILVLAPIAVEQHVLNSIDTAVQLIQAEELRRSGFQSMAISYPARALDPTEEFLPFVPPFVFLSGGQWQSIFSSFYAALIAPLLRLGLGWVFGLAMVSTAAAVAAVQLLPGTPAPAPWLALVGTPLWLYAMSPTEVPLALACGMAALAAAARIEGPRGDWASGALLGLAALLRDEMLLVGPGLLYARSFTGVRWPGLLRTCIGLGIPLVVMAVVDQWWFDRPMLAHLRHAVPGLDVVLPRARARLPHLGIMSWAERLQTLFVYWLVGHSGPVAATVAAAIAVTHLARRLAPWVVPAIAVTAAAIVHWADLLTLLAEPRIHAGLFRLSPFLLLALLPRAPGAPIAPVTRLAWVTTASILLVVLLTVNTEGGKSTGPRLIMTIWVLLAAAAVDILAGYVRAARDRWSARATAGAGLALVIGSILMQMAVVLPSREGRANDDAEAARLVRALGDQVIVNDTMFDIQLTAPLYFDRAIMLAQPRQRRTLSRRLAERGVPSFMFVMRPGAGHGANFPDYREAGSWQAGRFVISRWVLATTGAP